MTTAAMIPLDKIRLHPDNVRRVAEADEEMVESIKSVGIIQPVVVVEDGDQYLLIAGHRRLDGARKAGHTQVRAEVNDRLVTRAQQIEAMLVENGNREDLTAIEEAKAYEQLTFEGYKPKDIAKATGRSVTTVQARLRLTTLSDDAQEGVHAHQITLEQAAVLADLEEFPEILARVEKTIGTANFSHTIMSVRWDVERETKHRETRNAFTAAGLELIEQPEEWDYTNGPVPYRGSLDDGVADAWYETGDAYRGPALAVKVPKATDVDADAAAKEQRESQWEKDRAEREARAQARAVAQNLRVAHFRGLFAKVKLPAAVLPAVAAGLAVQSVNDSQQFLDTFAGPGLERTSKNTWDNDWSIADQVKEMNAPALTGFMFAHLCVELESLISGHLREPEQAQAGLDYLDLLTSTGYVLSDTETDLVGELKQRLVDLQPEGEDQ